MRIRVTVIHRNAERVACRASLIGPLEKFLPKRTARSMNILACDQKNMVRFSIREILEYLVRYISGKRSP